MILGVLWKVYKDEFERFCMFTYCIWWERNRKIHGGYGQDVDTQVEFAFAFIDEFRKSSVIESISINKQSLIVRRWQPPSLGFISRNTNASVISGVSFVGIGLVFYDHA